MKPGHLHQTPGALLACPAIARRATADENAPVFISLRRGKPFHSACEVVSFRYHSIALVKFLHSGVRLVFLINAHLTVLK